MPAGQRITDNIDASHGVSGLGLLAAVLTWFVQAQTGLAGCGDYVVAADEPMATHAGVALHQPAVPLPCRGPQCHQERPRGPVPGPLPPAEWWPDQGCLASVELKVAGCFAQWLEVSKLFSRLGFPRTLLRPPRA